MVRLAGKGTGERAGSCGFDPSSFTNTPPHNLAISLSYPFDSISLALKLKEHGASLETKNLLQHAYANCPLNQLQP